jgi:glycerol-3-phosphate O-acyltransferase
MRNWLGLDRLALRLARVILAVLVRARVLPDPPHSVVPDGGLVCYVLESKSLSDLLVLDQVCLERSLPRPTAPLDRLGEPRSAVMLGGSPGRRMRRAPSTPSRLMRIVEAARAEPLIDVQLIPVSIFWGRAPDRQHSLFKLLFSESWAVTGPLYRLVAILLHGRDTLVQFSPAVPLRDYANPDVAAARGTRRLHRVLRVHFRRVRTAVIGPDLSRRRALVTAVVRSSAVRRAAGEHARSTGMTRRKALELALHHADEVAADYSYAVVRVLERVLTWWWTQRYEGIEVRHLHKLKEVAEGSGIVYVPCHRSHVDYLLLSYVLFEHGFVVPHIAAGINLNLPLLGSVLRRGGAFFMRRSFRDDPLYAAVFLKYLSLNLVRGVPIEYFIEGTRSRTGRLLEPRKGMLAMTLHSYLHSYKRPLIFVPVYVGYEHVFEGRSYIDELSGGAKKRESLRDLVRALHALRGKYGRVYVSFGEPIFPEPLLDQYNAGWRNAVVSDGERPPWLAAATADLAQRIMTNINAAAAVNPRNLLATALLSTPKRAMVEKDLHAQLDLCARLARRAPYSPLVTVTEMSGAEIAAWGERTGLLRRRPHPLGDVLSLGEEEAVLMTYYRNNVLHVFALPSLVACCFINNRTLAAAKLIELCGLAYPFLRSELFLRWTEEELPQVLRRTLEEMVHSRLLTAEADGEALTRPPSGAVEAVQLSMLAQSTLQTLERFYMTIALLFKHGSGNISQADLENLCYLMAQRMTLLHGLDAPEFFAKSLFRNFIQVLKSRGVLSVNARGLLVYDESIRSVEADAKLVLSDQIRHSVLQVTHV